MRPVKNPSLKPWNSPFPSIEWKRGTRANQAKNSRSKLGKERMRRIPERRLKRISLFFMVFILSNQKAIFKNVLNFQRDLLEYKPMRILLVEDDKGIVRFVRKGLLENSLSVDVAYNGEEGLTSAVHMKYDLIVLDIMLPKMDGREVLQNIRSMDIQTPVIFLTAKDAEADIVKGLNLGADDYLTKPFSLNELLARIQAILRRANAVTPLSRLQVANLVLEPDGHRVYREKNKIELTPKEYALLEFFMRHSGQIITRTMISEKIFDYHFDTSTNVVDVHVSHLRNKIDKDFEPKLLHTVKGVGYVLEDRG
jgi:DNA-binding response OmpR family regulator